MELKNERLQVTVTGAQNQRFDNTAMVTQVVLDGKYAFCTPEQVRPERRTTEGAGLCGEIVLPGAAEAAKAGQWFCKPGVGLLKQYADGAPYDMWRRYEARHFALTQEASGNSAVFRQKGTVSGGYGVDIEKRFTLDKNRLILDISVWNIGEKPMDLQEYQHNFLSIAGIPAGAGYVLEVPFDEELSHMESCTMRQGDEIRLPSAVEVAGSTVSWIADLEGKVMYHRSGKIDPAAPRCWKLRRTGSDVCVMEQTAFLPTRFDFWAVEHCLCPEVYHTAHVAPGQSATWRRTWTFEA